MSEYETITQNYAREYVAKATGERKDEELENSFKIVQQQYKDDPAMDHQTAYAIAAGRVIYQHEHGEINTQALQESQGQMRMKV